MLLGMIGADGTVGYLRPAIQVTHEFVASTSKEVAGHKPETRFRFAEPCQTSRCVQWSGESCGVVDWAVQSPIGQRLTEADAPLPHCAIRPSCRWFHQRGRDACAICPYVIHSPLESSAAEVPPSLS